MFCALLAVHDDVGSCRVTNTLDARTGYTLYATITNRAYDPTSFSAVRTSRQRCSAPPTVQNLLECCCLVLGSRAVVEIMALWSRRYAADAHKALDAGLYGDDLLRGGTSSTGATEGSSRR